MKRSPFKRRSPKFPFSPWVRELFRWSHCWVCNTGEADCLHHIFGRVSASPFNAAPMHNATCHIDRDGKAGQHLTHLTREAQQEYLRKTIDWLNGQFEPTKQDREFIEQYASEENRELAFKLFGF